MKEYVHTEPGREGRSLPWPHRVVEELVLAHGGRPFIAVLCESTVGSACIGAGSLRHLFVPGYVVTLKSRRDVSGNPVSIVEPVRDADDLAALRDILSARFPGVQAGF